MSFLTSLALLAAVLVGAPVAAHYLRRKRANEIALPTASLLAATPPTARRRSAIEDKGLLAIRILAVLLLALLGATPFISCSHVALLRKDGASVAMVVVLDDSMSMRAPHPAGGTRFERAKRAAVDLLDGAEPGDSFAIVLAGTRARVLLASTTDVRAARAALEDAAPSDRGTDLTAAVSLAGELLRDAPQPDRRVVLLSDLADGTPDAPILELGGDVALWYPLPDLESRPDADCGIVETERGETTVGLSIKCYGETAERPVEIVNASDPKSVVARGSVPPGGGAITLKLPADAPADLDAVLAAGDALRANDTAPVAQRHGAATVGVLADAAATRVETGGPPPVEQAFTALDLGSIVRPISSVPEHEEELKPYVGLVFDDPPGFTPEERRSLGAWVEGGGTLLLALGKQAASAPLGSGFGSIVPGVVRFTSAAPTGAKPETCTFFGPSAPGLSDIAPKGRAALAPEAIADGEVLCAFGDGAPLLLRRHMGKGAIYVVSIPFDLETSDFVLRPAFLSLLDRYVDIARTGGGSKVVEAGKAFPFVGATRVEGDLLPAGESRPTKIEVSAGPSPRVEAPRIGRYRFTVDGTAPETRYALAPALEGDLRPRSLSAQAKDPSLGGEARKLDASPYVAMGLLALLVMELLVRLLLPQAAPQREPDQ